MGLSKLIMGRAANIANRVLISTQGMGIEPHYVFTETEFRQFIQCLTAEQRIMCAQAAREAVSHPFAEAELAGEVVEACRPPEVF